MKIWVWFWFGDDNDNDDPNNTARIEDDDFDFSDNELLSDPMNKLDDDSIRALGSVVVDSSLRLKVQRKQWGQIDNCGWRKIAKVIKLRAKRQFDCRCSDQACKEFIVKVLKEERRLFGIQN
jgi:hypothetical protein